MTNGAVILAAGAGQRLGGAAKALLRRGERTFLETILATAREVDLVDAIVVAGPPHAGAVAAHARELGIRVVYNSAPERGMASSIALGFAAIAESTARAAWLWPVDHPDVTAGTLRALVAAIATHEVARPRFMGRGGHPPLVARELWARLAGCTGIAGGARVVLADADVISVEVADPAVVRDVDTPADLETR